MFQAVAEKVQKDLNGTLDDLLSEIQNIIRKIMHSVNRDYSSLLANQNIFKTLEAARDKIWDLLNEVDERFGLVLHPTVRSGIPNRSNGLTTVDVDIEGSVPVVGPETTLKNPVVATGARDAHSSATNIKDNVRVKRESPFTTALEEDTIAEDVWPRSLLPPTTRFNE